MAIARLPEKDLRREFSEFGNRYPKLGDDELFVLWFLRAFVTDIAMRFAAFQRRGGECVLFLS